MLPRQGARLVVMLLVVGTGRRDIGRGPHAPDVSRQRDLRRLDAERHLERWIPLAGDPSAHVPGRRTDTCRKVGLRPVQLDKTKAETLSRRKVHSL